MPNPPESMLLGTHDDITMVDKYKQSTTPPLTAIYCRPISPHPMPLLGYFLHCSLRNGPCGDRTWVADSRVQRRNHWAIKGTWMTKLLMLGLLVTLLPPFWNQSLLARATFNQGGELPLTGEPGLLLPPVLWTVLGLNPGRRFQSQRPKPLSHKDTWTTRLLMLGWFFTLARHCAGTAC